ncbi:hypothetical protein ACQZV8_17705 [Magnetococcales bacterium HHB-1]
MDIMDWIDVSFKTVDSINFLWNFYAVVVLAILGWIYSGQNELRKDTQKAVTIVFLAFSLYNIVMLYSSYVLLHACITELQSAIGRTPEMKKLSKETLNLVNGLSFENRQIVFPFLHLLADSLVIYTIWFRKTGDAPHG